MTRVEGNASASGCSTRAAVTTMVVGASGCANAQEQAQQSAVAARSP
jgi:hypothetical protein